MLLTEVSALLDGRDRVSALVAVDRFLGSSPSCRIVQCDAAERGFDLAALRAIMDASQSSIRSARAELDLHTTLMSLVSGASRAFSNVAGTVGRLLDGFQERGDLSLVDLASRLLGATSGIVNLFGSAIEGLMSGRLAGGLLHVGDMLSGALGDIIAGAGNFIGGALGTLGSLATSGLLQMQLKMAGIFAAWPPALSLTALAALNPGSLVSGLVSGLGGLASRIKALCLDTAEKMLKKASNALASVMELPGRVLGAVRDALSKSFSRLAGLGLIDGLDALGFMSKANAARLGRIGLRALLGTGAAGRIMDPVARMVAAGSLAGLLAREPAALGGLDLARRMAGATRNRTGETGLLLDASLTGVSDFLSDGCAFQTAVQSAVGCVRAGVRTGIDDLLATLECRRSTMDRASTDARERSRASAAMSERLKALEGLLGGLPAGCAYAGDRPLGACS